MENVNVKIHQFSIRMAFVVIVVMAAMNVMKMIFQYVLSALTKGQFYKMEVVYVVQTI